MRYTIGVLFAPGRKSVLLILKQKPLWQKGRFNFPGGKFEGTELPAECISREMAEEAAVDIPASLWNHIGIIRGDDYTVNVFTHELVQYQMTRSLTDESVIWYRVDQLPENKLSNISAILELALMSFESKDFKLFSLNY